MKRRAFLKACAAAVACGGPSCPVSARGHLQDADFDDPRWKMIGTPYNEHIRGPRTVRVTWNGIPLEPFTLEVWIHDEH